MGTLFGKRSFSPSKEGDADDPASHLALDQDGQQEMERTMLEPKEY
jgi:hypothetical protein